MPYLQAFDQNVIWLQRLCASSSKSASRTHILCALELAESLSFPSKFHSGHRLCYTVVVARESHVSVSSIVMCSAFSISCSMHSVDEKQGEDHPMRGSTSCKCCAFWWSCKRALSINSWVLFIFRITSGMYVIRGVGHAFGENIIWNSTPLAYSFSCLLEGNFHWFGQEVCDAESSYWHMRQVPLCVYIFLQFCLCSRSGLG